MNLRNVFTVYLKELREAVRDRRTLVSMIVIPTIVIPGLMAFVGIISINVMKQVRSEAAPVMVVGGEDSPRFTAVIRELDTVRVEPLAEDWKRRIADKEVRAVVEIPAGLEATLAAGGEATVTIYNYGGELKSGYALGELRKRFVELREKIVAERLAERGLPATVIKPFDIKSENVAPPEKVGGNAIGGIIPYLFIILCFTGAMYPAIDVTAGEKERGTMETILCSPIRRVELVFGKFLTVLTASLATVLFSFISLAVSFSVGAPLLLKSAAAGAGKAAAASANVLPTLDPLGLLTVIAMVFPVAMFFAAVQLTIALFAKTSKEAQSYIAPLVAVIVMPAVVAMLPGVELNLKLALVPILNVSLVSKELVSGVFNWGHIALIFGSSCAYAAAALALCVRMFNRESVIFRA